MGRALGARAIRNAPEEFRPRDFGRMHRSPGDSVPKRADDALTAWRPRLNRCVTTHARLLGIWRDDSHGAGGMRPAPLLRVVRTETGKHLWWGRDFAVVRAPKRPRRCRDRAGRLIQPRHGGVFGGVRIRRRGSRSQARADADVRWRLPVRADGTRNVGRSLTSILGMLSGPSSSSPQHPTRCQWSQELWFLATAIPPAAPRSRDLRRARLLGRIRTAPAAGNGGRRR
jgi:hypothetical protein